MDSGSAVPMLSPGWSETVAAKLLTVASDRWGAAACASLFGSCRATVSGTAPTESMLLRKARFLAVDKAGRRRAATTAMTPMTTSSSISVKARHRIFIYHLVGCLHEGEEHGGCQNRLRAKRLISEA